MVKVLKFACSVSERASSSPASVDSGFDGSLQRVPELVSIAKSVAL